MGTLSRWESAAPEGQRLVAAAPLVGCWTPRNSLALVPLMGIPVFESSFKSLLIWDAVALALVLGWASWCRRYRRPTGLASVVDGGVAGEPVLLVTDTAVLLTGARRRSRFGGEIEPTGLGRPLPGLTAVQAIRHGRLTLDFVDGSSAVLRQRQPVRGAAERVEGWAALALRRSGSGRPLSPRSAARL